MTEPISHKAPTNKDPKGQDKALTAHLREVATLAKQFADQFGCGFWAQIAGLLHDLGKFNQEFQDYINSPPGTRRRGEINHSSPGAIHAKEEYGECYGLLLAYLIAGHHAGLPDYSPTGAHPRASLEQRLKNDIQWLTKTRKNPKTQEFLASREELQAPVFPDPGLKHETPLTLSLWLRMLFSCLVDADYLATEAYMDAQRATLRTRPHATLQELKQRYDSHIETLQANAPPSALNRLRAELQQQCTQKGRENPTGIYTLTVPTGGGKTLASMGFALEHAIARKKSRIIYAIPFTSIIEQTVDVYRKIWNAESVIEHHSNIRHDRDLPQNAEKADDAPGYRQRLATENWDAPIIVTTNVQFFESLFASRTSRCRKLHNIVNSVVILDEAQTFPPEFLAPILAVIKELRDQYNVTFVLCTATQPAFKTIPNTPSTPKFQTDGEICPAPEALAKQLKRVTLHPPQNFNAPDDWDVIAAELATHDQALCIVNTKASCRDLYQKLTQLTQATDDNPNMHLSTNMCGAHRAEKIKEMRARLKAGDKIRVISTSLIEAGVDVDFPVVYREGTGLDSIAQAAGRCNREGKLPEGNVHIFTPPKTPPPGLMRKGWQATMGVLEDTPTADPLQPQTMTDYFRNFYGSVNSLDAKGIVSLLPNDPRDLKFRTAGEKFVLIEDGGIPVIVPYDDDARQILEKERDGDGELTKTALRNLQRYTVNVRQPHLDLMLDREEVRTDSNVYILNECEENYCPNIGLNIALLKKPTPAPESAGV